MNVEILLKKLVERNVKISVKEDKLLCQLPEDGIEDELLNELKINKEEIKRVLLEVKEGKSRRGHKIKKVYPKSPNRELSFAQQRLWTLDQIEGSNHYNITNALLIKGNLNIDIFQKVFNTIVERHEILRTIYIQDEKGGVYQKIKQIHPFNVSIENLLFLDKEKREPEVRKIQMEESKLAFDLKKDNLLRVKLIQIEEDEFIVLVTMHHIATDGWSIGILVKEFSLLYKAYDKGEVPELPKLEIQYSDYAHWQQEHLKGENLEKLKNYWSNQLDNLPVLHRLKLDKTRPKIQTFEGNTIHSKIDNKTLRRLKTFCNQQNVTLFTGLYSIFTVLLSRYSDENDIVVGTPIANREQSEVENLIGFFANMLILRNNVSENLNFKNLIDQSKSILFDAYSHQQMPFDMLVSTLQPERNLSYNSLFQIMFVFQNNEKPEIELPNISLQQVELFKPFALYDLSLTIDQVNNGLALSWEYNTSIFRASTIKRMISHFEELFKSLIEFPEKNVFEVEIMPNSEREKILYDFNQTDKSYPKDKTIVDLFVEQAKKKPEDVAIKFDEKKYTYRELDQLSNQLANYLIEVYKIKPDDLIGIQLARSEKMPLSIITILKSGGAYVPIGMDYPAEKVSYIRKDAKLKVILNEEELSKFFLVKQSYSERLVLQNIDTNDLAYCIYTSGSTGIPKGVLNSHSGLFNRLIWMKEDLEITNKDLFIQKTPYTFDVSVWEFLLPLIVGSTLVIAEPYGHKDPLYLKKIIEKEEISIIHFVPSMLGVFLDFFENIEISTIRNIVCSGEELYVHHITKAKTIFPNAQIYNFYGPTEAGIDVTSINLTNSSLLNGVSIGKPVANTKIYITNNFLELQPIGVPGEILISGTQVAKGYLNRDELTTEKFIKDPFDPNRQVYKTGDVGLWEKEGTIKYIGRKDNQVKIRGNRIELGNITTKLLEKPGIKDATVIVNKKDREPHLTAYLVSDENQCSTELRKYLSTKLSDYEIPSFYIQLEKIPLTSNGKVNTKELLKSDHDILKSKTTFVNPENELEERLVEIFAEGLNRNQDEIGTHDNFFDLGADSIKLIKILNQINQEFNTEITPILLFQYTTINEFAIHVFDVESNNEESAEDALISDEMDSIIGLMEG